MELTLIIAAMLVLYGMLFLLCIRADTSANIEANLVRRANTAERHLHELQRVLRSMEQRMTCLEKPEQPVTAFRPLPYSEDA